MTNVELTETCGKCAFELSCQRALSTGSKLQINWRITGCINNSYADFSPKWEYMPKDGDNNAI